MKKRLALCLIVLLVIVLIFSSGCTRTVAKINGNTVLAANRTVAVILDMEDYEGEKSDLKVDFLNSKRMKDALVKIGCREENLLIKQDNIDIKTINDCLAWLEKNSKAGDNILFYLTAHGSYIEQELSWNTTFPNEWKKLNDRNRILIIDACKSEKFIHRSEGDKGEGISVSSCNINEIAWCGLEEEGLPIIGNVFTYYFTDAITNRKADINNDKYVSFEEAINFTNQSVQTYMKEYVFAVPEFLEGYHALGIFPEKVKSYPNAIIKDGIEGELLLYKIQ